MKQSLVQEDSAYSTALAIVGMSGRFPGANSIDDFWRNLAGGVKSIQKFSDEELLAAGVDPKLLRNPDFVKVGARVDRIDLLDAAFFGFTPREAEVMDPQHRLFLECCWEALEDAACDVTTYRGLIGTFAGSAVSSYMLRNLLPNKELMEMIGQLQLDVGNDRDSLASMVSYKLNLKGPAIAVQSFCSTSLVATHLACQSLLNYECDMALAGGVAIITPQESGYLYEEGGILSPDGECRTFDARAHGSVMGHGLGVVVIKRLQDALDDGDHIYAVIRGSTMNNDGNARVSYTAPGTNGQSSVISAALSVAGVHPEQISYIETHGTATPLGDAVELAAMMKAFRRKTRKKQFCAIGSVKPNVGHLDRAAGVAGLIKTSLALHNRQIPPSLNYERSAPEVDLENSPFYVNTKLQEWESVGGPRRAGVSSFGLGGTNAHVVLEEAPLQEASKPHRSWNLLVFSGKTATARDTATKNLYQHLLTHTDLELADVAHTLQIGRSTFNYRAFTVCQDVEDAVKALAQGSERIQSVQQVHRDRPTTFLLSGDYQHVPYAAIWDLYREEPAFQKAVAASCLALQKLTGLDMHAFFVSRAYAELTTQQAAYMLFITEYALAQVLQEWGVRPQSIFGAGVGEFVGACLAGILSLEGALKLAGKSIDLHVLSAERGVFAQERDAVREFVAQVESQLPGVPFFSQTMDAWITPEQVSEQSYWVNVLLSTPTSTEAGLEQVLQQPDNVLLEIGFGRGLATHLQGRLKEDDEQRELVLSCFSNKEAHGSEQILTALGQLWLAGVTVDWAGFSEHQQRARLSLPTYPFERKRFWIEAPDVVRAVSASTAQSQIVATRNPDPLDWFYIQDWERQPLDQQAQRSKAGPYLLFVDTAGIADKVATRLEREGQIVTRVYAASQFAHRDEGSYGIHPEQFDDYLALFRGLERAGKMPRTILHAWSVTSDKYVSNPETFATMQNRGFYSLLYVAQELGKLFYEQEVHLLIASDKLHSRDGQEAMQPEKATVLGAATVISQENLALLCRSIDIDAEASIAQSADDLYAECRAQAEERITMYRDGERWVRTYKPRRLEPVAMPHPRLRKGGIYLIPGGLGQIGLHLAEYLARTLQANVVLSGRSSFPARETWEAQLADVDTPERTRNTIQRLMRIEKLGSKVLVHSVDVADEAQMRGLIEQISAEFGALHGVFYTAGVTPDSAFHEIQEITPTECETLFKPKVQGLYTLEKVLAPLDLDFCVIFSSIASVLGGLGFVGYTAANSFADAFVTRHNQRSTQAWLTINWDTWKVREETAGAIGSTVAVYSMTPDEGLNVLEQALASGEHHLVNSTGDLHVRIRQWVYLEALKGESEPAQPTSAASESRAEVNTVPSAGEYERKLLAIWQQVLGITEIGLNDNFFDIGGNSLIALQLIAKIKKTFRVQLSIITLFEAPTISSMLKHLLPEEKAVPVVSAQSAQRQRQTEAGVVAQQDIAIIGMAGRFPGADSVEQFWQNLCDGIESITFFNDEELIAAGVDPELLKDPAFVKARPILSDVEHFDSIFFGYNPREAELMDPQHRLFMEACWEVLERGGYDPQRYKGQIGVFGGTNASTYLYSAFAIKPDLIEQVGGYQIAVSTDKDSLTTGVSYKFNLRGPSVAVQTFCSTSLVATHMACQSLIQGDCSMALAGGVSIRVPSVWGHLYEEGGMESPDGHCRTFDAEAKGSMFGDGVGVVMLKRLTDALNDGDTIYAVIKGSAMNNDGSLKVSYTAPSVAGQAEVITTALAKAGISAESISYIEAHGTATELGDPIEVTSLTKAFRMHTTKTGYCAIGSVKTNVGHLDRAAGVSGLIKTALALKHQVLPPNLHFKSPNPEIDFENSPFFVNTTLRPWHPESGLRRAGLNSLGMGGTNVHVVLEEAPEREKSTPSSKPQVLLLSARTDSALDTMTKNLQSFVLKQHEGGEILNLADVAYTLQVGRKVFEHRRVVVCENEGELETLLENRPPTRVFSHVEKRTERPVVFLFPGVGEQYPGMALDLYKQESVFKETVDQCARILQPLLGMDIREALYPEGITEPKETANASPFNLRALMGRNGSSLAALGPLAQTTLAQPVTFVIEYALGRLLMHWGIIPQAMLGYSVGEYVAACLAEVLSLDDALLVVARRAQMIERQEKGAMLTVALPVEQIQPYLGQDIDVAAINGPNVCVLSGPVVAIEHVEKELSHKEIAARRVDSTHAFHSRMLTHVQNELTALVKTFKLQAPRVPYISNVTGTWITAEQATDPTYWSRHMCQTVQFSTAIGQLLKEPDWVLLEVGAGQTIGSFIKQHTSFTAERMMLVHGTLPSRHERQASGISLLTTLGRLWLVGVVIDWEQTVVGERRQRVLLPTYPFERKRHWILPDTLSSRPAANRVSPIAEQLEKDPDRAKWFYLPGWKQSLVRTPNTQVEDEQNAPCWMLFSDSRGLGESLSVQLRKVQHTVITVTPGSAFANRGPDAYRVDPTSRTDYETLLSELRKQGKIPNKIVYLWTVTDEQAAPVNHLDEHEHFNSDFYRLMALAQALGDQGGDACELFIVSNGLYGISGEESLAPEKALITGIVRVLPQEYPHVRCSNIDLIWPQMGARQADELLTMLSGELSSEITDAVISLRGKRRWVQSFEPVALQERSIQCAHLRKNGVYLITGGLGGIGLAMAEHLARSMQARLVLVGRSALPPREEWVKVLEQASQDDRVAARIRQILHLEELGSEVLVAAADVVDEAVMREVITQARSRFGTIHGVLHTAGLPGIGLIQLKTPAMAAEVMAPKIQGTLVLERVLSDVPLDFIVLFSSMTSTTGGGPGQVDYCAANAFMDAYAQYWREHDASRLVIAVDWGEWQWNAWSAGLVGYDTLVQEFFIENRRRTGISFEEGSDALQRILAHNLPQIVVSTQDFAVVIEASKDFTTETIVQRTQEARQSQQLYERPTLLGVEYVAPESDLEIEIAEIWSLLLGIDRVGVNDNFFELGGHSLLGTQLISRIRRKFQIDLPLATIFESATVAELAMVVELILIEEIEKLGETDIEEEIASRDQISSR